ncbi:MAG: ABC transporter ATP-binding protein [Anaerolineaceae bacterium]|nr:ABC transporter ATP-binding protein [Anaerolineaceae bacterium]
MKQHDYAIRTDRLTRRFGDLVAVNQLSIEVPTGKIFGFLGPNGSGKTTTIRLLLGLMAADEGSAEVLGYDVAAQADQIRIQSGALLEHTGLYERMTAYDNLEFYARVNRLNGAERRARIQELLEALGLWERRKDVVVDWSRGMKQKLAIARALLHHPRLLFLDEPTAGLDPVAAAALRDDLEELSALQGVTVFLTTHNLPEAERLCSTVGVINAGRLLSVGSPDELRLRRGGSVLKVVGSGFTDALIMQLKQKDGVSDVRKNDQHIDVAVSEDCDTQAIVRWLVMENVEIDEVRKGSASLEEAFLRLLEEDDVE